MATGVGDSVRPQSAARLRLPSARERLLRENARESATPSRTWSSSCWHSWPPSATPPRRLW